MRQNRKKPGLCRQTGLAKAWLFRRRSEVFQEHFELVIIGRGEELDG